MDPRISYVMLSCKGHFVYLTKHTCVDGSLYIMTCPTFNTKPLYIVYKQQHIVTTENTGSLIYIKLATERSLTFFMFFQNLCKMRESTYIGILSLSMSLSYTTFVKNTSKMISILFIQIEGCKHFRNQILYGTGRYSYCFDHKFNGLERMILHRGPLHYPFLGFTMVIVIFEISCHMRDKFKMMKMAVTGSWLICTIHRVRNGRRLNQGPCFPFNMNYIVCQNG